MTELDERERETLEALAESELPAAEVAQAILKVTDRE